MPDALLRLVLWLAAHTIYRLDVKGAENVPSHGGALLVPNHGSLVDAVLVLAATGPAGPLPHVQGHLRPSAAEAVLQDPPRHPDLVAAGASRDDPLAA
jgi:1-acyl-sn-glycerol-3-phosphate acyltransferase